MKITTSQLRKIIRTEYQKILLEQDNSWEKPATSDEIAAELENAWKANNRAYMKTQPDGAKWRTSADVDDKILDMAIAVRDKTITMKDALMQVEKL